MTTATIDTRLPEIRVDTYALLVVALAFIVGVMAITNLVSLNQALLFLTGGILVFALYQASFGFTGGWKRFATEGRSRSMRAQFFMIGITAIVFIPLMSGAADLGRSFIGAWAPVGVSVIFGSFLFGLGMQLGGGCGSGTLFTVGGGSARMLVTLAGFIIGATVGTWHLPFWLELPSLPVIRFGQTFGALGGTLLTLAGLAAIIGLLAFVEKRKHGNVEPIFSGAYHITMIRSDQFNDSPYSQIEVERNRKVDGSALYSLYLLFQEHAYFLPLLFLVFMLGTGLAGERGKHPTIRFLRTQPISDRAILFGKFVHSALWSILLTILLVGIVVLLGTIFDRFGDWNYPVLHHDGVTEINLEDYKGTFSYHYGYQLLPLGKALLQTISLLILVILFVLAFTQFLSLLFRNTFVVYVVSGLVFICGYVLATKFFPHISQWTPFPYLNVSQVVNGELSTMLDQPYLDFYGGIRVILAAIVATMVLSFVAARRRV